MRAILHASKLARDLFRNCQLIGIRYARLASGLESGLARFSICLDLIDNDFCTKFIAFLLTTVDSERFVSAFDRLGYLINS